MPPIHTESFGEDNFCSRIDVGVGVGVFEFGVGGADLGLSAVTYSLGHCQQLSAPRSQPELEASQPALLRRLKGLAIGTLSWSHSVQCRVKSTSRALKWA